MPILVNRPIPVHRSRRAGAARPTRSEAVVASAARHRRWSATATAASFALFAAIGVGNAEIVSRPVRIPGSGTEHAAKLIESAGAPSPAPALVFFNNASAPNATPDAMPLFEYLAGQGMKVFDVAYARPLPRLEDRNAEITSGVIRDAKSVLRSIRASAGDFGVDPKKIVVAGLGDGGAFALASALVADFSPEGSGPSWKPDAVVALAPFLYEKGSLPSVLGGSVFHRTMGAGNIERFQPANGISRDSPPVLLCAMDRIPHTDTEAACRFKTVCDRVGARCDLTVFWRVPFRNFFKYTDFNRHVQHKVHTFLHSTGILPNLPDFEEPNVRKSRELLAAKEGMRILDTAKIVEALADPAYGSEDNAQYETRTYRTQDGHDLKLVIVRAKGPHPKKAQPAFVYFHGGGWVGGAFWDWWAFGKDLVYLANRGMVGVSVEYRTHQHGGAKPFDGLKDCKAAIRYLREHASELGIDPERIVASGGSAGGHLAAALGTVGGFEHPDQNLSVSSRPNLLVLHNPVMDNGPWGYGYTRIKDHYPAVSPIHQLSKDTPPILLFSGVSEGIVPKDSMAYLKRKMDALGVPCDLNVLMKGGHAQTTPFANGAIAKYLLWKTDTFLAGHGYIEGPPTIDIAKEKADGLFALWDWNESPFGLDYLEVMQKRADAGEFRNRNEGED